MRVRVRLGVRMRVRGVVLGDVGAQSVGIGLRAQFGNARACGCGFGVREVGDGGCNFARPGGSIVLYEVRIAVISVTYVSVEMPHAGG